MRRQAMLAARAEVGPGFVEHALWQSGTLTKTWAMRGTLHALPTTELPLWTGAQAALRPRTESPVWLRHFELTAEQAQAILEQVPAALAGGPLTREELAGEVARRSGHPELEDRLSGGYGDLLKPVAFRGDLVFAPSDGPRVRFARPAPFAPLDPGEATREVARRFVSVYGPASREDLAKWFGTPSAAQAGRWLAFDQYVVASPRDDLPPDRRKQVYRPGGWFSPVLLVDGEIAGVWREDADAVAIEPFASVGAGMQAAAHEEASRLGASDVTLPARLRS